MEILLRPSAKQKDIFGICRAIQVLIENLGGIRELRTPNVVGSAIPSLMAYLFAISTQTRADSQN